MKRNLILFSMAMLLISAVLFSSRIIKDIESKYEQTLVSIEDINSRKDININNTLSFKNTGKKYLEVEIEEDFYYGYQHGYINDDNIHFFSMNGELNEDKLKDIENELYANTHGDEIQLLEKVIIYGSSDNDAAGSHTHSIRTYKLPMSFYNFFPEELNYDVPYMKSTINIFGVQKTTEIEDIAAVLSHEYGHHYTQHYFNLSFDKYDEETEYFNLRFNGVDQVVTDRVSYEHYIDEHMWYLAEIAAEDYVYFMGSETAQRTLKFYDSKQKYDYYSKNKKQIVYDNELFVLPCKNGMPHENVHLPMPIEIDGLDDYFYSFISEESPFTNTYDSIGSLNLSVEGSPKDNKCFFTWDQPYTDPDVIYTLIGYGEDGYVDIIVKTARGDQKGYAYLGYYGDSKAAGLKQYLLDHNVYYDFNTDEIMYFRVSITFPDGAVLMSDPITIND